MKSLIAAIALTLLAMLAGLSAPAYAFDLARTVPAQALPLLPTLSAQARELAPAIPAHYFAALIEHESGCPALKSMCWSPTARLKTQREEGAGLGQLTRAWRTDGTQRFDALAEARRLDPQGLNDLRWDTVYQRPDLQMRTMVLMTRQAWHSLTPLVPDTTARLHMTDAAYNGGTMGVINERRACALRTGCNPGAWFGHVALVCLKSTKPLYGTRSACDINRHHVQDVTVTRMPKYQGLV